MTTLLFPGQGSQEPGMGNGLLERFPEMVTQADEILGYSVEALCADDSGRLDQTCHTQPALYVISCLAFEAWRADRDGVFAFTAGHSVGEYAALYAAGAVEFATGLRLVQQRGELMHRQTGGGMAAVLGLELSSVEQVLADGGFDGIDIANLNAPQQIIMSGLKQDVESAESAFLEAGARRYVPLNVSGAFHSRHMVAAAEEFGHFLEGCSFADPICPVVSNVEARPYEIRRARELLQAQIHSPVRWVETIEYLREQGEMEFIELGPGRVLTGLLRRIR